MQATPWPDGDAEAPQVKTHIFRIGVRIDDPRWEQSYLSDRVAIQVHPDEFMSGKLDVVQKSI
jgi:hypothetical protein